MGWKRMSRSDAADHDKKLEAIMAKANEERAANADPRILALAEKAGLDLTDLPTSDDFHVSLLRSYMKWGDLTEAQWPHVVRLTAQMSPKDAAICDRCGGFKVHADEFERCICLPGAPEGPLDGSEGSGAGEHDRGGERTRSGRGAPRRGQIDGTCGGSEMSDKAFGALFVFCGLLSFGFFGLIVWAIIRVVGALT